MGRRRGSWVSFVTASWVPGSSPASRRVGRRRTERRRGAARPERRAAPQGGGLLRDARLGAEQTFVQQLAALRAAQQRIALQQVSVAAAVEDLRVQQQRYSLGASTLLDVLTSQTTLDAARLALIQARQDFRVARAQLESLVGRELQ